MRTTFNRTSILGITIVIALVFTSSVSAQKGREAPNVIAEWQTELESIDQLLVAGKHGKAYRQSSALLQTMTDRIIEGEGAFPLMAAASILRAIAESGRGNLDDAYFDLYLAEAFRADVSNFDFSRYGDAGVPLAEFEILEPKSAGRSIEALGGKPPKRLSSPAPDYPDAMSDACVQGIVITQMVVTRKGRASRPRILHSDGGPVMAYAAFEAIRQWRFKPARVDGVDFAVFFNLTINFRRQGCPASR